MHSGVGQAAAAGFEEGQGLTAPPGFTLPLPPGGAERRRCASGRWTARLCLQQQQQEGQVGAAVGGEGATRTHCQQAGNPAAGCF